MINKSCYNNKKLIVKRNLINKKVYVLNVNHKLYRYHIHNHKNNYNKLQMLIKYNLQEECHILVVVHNKHNKINQVHQKKMI